MKDAEEAGKIFDTYRDVLMNGFIPDIMQMALGDVRKLLSEDSSQVFKDFLESTKEVPEQAVVVLQMGQAPRMLTTETGRFMSFA